MCMNFFDVCTTSRKENFGLCDDSNTSKILT
jgi:hypothetical protein